MFQLAALMFIAVAPEPMKVTVPPAPELKRAIEERDAELFEVVFLRCEPKRLRSMLTDDFEMYHDRDGVVAKSADKFVADYAQECAARMPAGWSSRRELVRETLVVDHVPGFGAIEDGEHRFYERKGQGPEHLAGQAHFTHLWALTPGGWKLARVLSFSHKAASEPAH